MAAYNIVVFLAFCLAHSSLQETALKKKFSVLSLNYVKDADDALLSFVKIAFTVAGDYNKTTHQQIVNNYVQDKLALVEAQPQDSPQGVYAAYNGIPLVYNMTLKELITVSYPKPIKNLAIDFNLQVYHRNNTQEGLFELKPALQSSF